jgi:thiamine biosynthesis lipoprotein
MLLSNTDFNDVIVDEDASTVYLSDPEMSLDVVPLQRDMRRKLVKNEVEEKGFSSG